MAVYDGPLAVRRGLDPGSYFVRSQRVEVLEPYAVIFGDPTFPEGKCNCHDYSIRIDPHIWKGFEPPCGRRTCVHIDAVNLELERARELCRAGGFVFSERMIPTVNEEPFKITRGSAMGAEETPMRRAATSNFNRRDERSEKRPFAASAGCIFHVQITPRAGSGVLRGGRSSNPDAKH